MTSTIVVPDSRLSVTRSSSTMRAPVLAVEVAGGLVGEEEARRVAEGARDGDALLLAAGELVGKVVRRGRRGPRG